MNPARGLVRALCLVAALTGVDGAGAAGMMKVHTLDGSPAMLSEFFEPGKWTVVMIWTTYCGICRTQFPLMNAFDRDHRGRDAKVVGIVLDGIGEIDRITAHIAAEAITFGNLVGEVGEVTASVIEEGGEPFAGTPTYLLFDSRGELAGQMPGPIDAGAIERFMHERPS